MQQYSSVDEYLADFSAEVQAILKDIRHCIRTAVPSAVESISYGMPAYKYKGKPLAYFAAFKNHIGFYATPNSHEAFSAELSKYKQGKGSVQFPIHQPMPFELIEKMLMFRKESIG